MDGKVRKTPAAGLPQTPNSLTESNLQRRARRPCHRTDSAVQCFSLVPLLRYGAHGRILDLRLCSGRGFLVAAEATPSAASFQGYTNQLAGPPLVHSR